MDTFYMYQQLGVAGRHLKDGTRKWKRKKSEKNQTPFEKNKWYAMIKKMQHMFPSSGTVCVMSHTCFGFRACAMFAQRG
jgi:hypothetical protein